MSLQKIMNAILRTELFMENCCRSFHSNSNEFSFEFF